MNQLDNHNHNLKILFDSFIDESDKEKLKGMVDLDSIDTVLRNCLSIDEMREAGSFFTGQKISTLAVEGFDIPITSESIVLDPTCGAGNLLLEVSKNLRIKKTLTKTLKIWGKVLHGFDFKYFFVEATKLRIVLEALNRGAKKDCSLDEALSLLTEIKLLDAMSLTQGDLENITHVIMNPPFSIWHSPNKRFWKRGKVNAAGIIFEHYINILPKGCSISAILPDVLRSGSRYEGWRNFVSSSVDGKCRVIGKFSTKTDVDVFLLTGVKNESKLDIQWHSLKEYSNKVSDFFDVCVGPLVAYRDPLEGNIYPYIHPKNSPQWKIIDRFDEFRAFSGRVIEPPFVVVKRTSSPSDKNRASASIIVGDNPVAVENHLIVLKPKNKKLSQCKKLLDLLKSYKTNEFLNERIRLRHLTVGVVKDIPWE